MTTSFSSLPIVDLSTLSQTIQSPASLVALGNQLYDVFATTGFAYLINAPLSFSHEDVFKLASDFFGITHAEKMSLAKKTFVNSNTNTYRGYFPTQSGHNGNRKEGFEIGTPKTPQHAAVGRHLKFNLDEANVWPETANFVDRRTQLEMQHHELQALSATLLSLLAVALGKPAGYFDAYLDDSLSTLRLLHYPPQATPAKKGDQVELCCTPHTDSGILTLLHQDKTGGLEVLSSDGKWVAAPYVPGSIVVNIGDLMGEVSGGRFVATMHRVRRDEGGRMRPDGMGRFSVPFFFEPGESCVVRSVDGGDGVVYGEHVRRKMRDWVEYEDLPDSEHAMGLPAV
ncbi:hypothetical protein LTR36_002480 [Oleoguttula mirabilis]|uniref:Fe2OG dioxygenase domain-containing protein n=1 Tax=Oleoguttula mirabilis TaxID=1507867 RepID=A0AAV9JKY5_9PEZI|nr:hypothetical protein LTR36_002480 [Oleoguttula mirabilis]